jgi:hypothetical protein
MNKDCCPRKQTANLSNGPTWATTARRTASWIVPSAILALMPKCPLCLAAYVALFTGLGISLAVASIAWWSVAIGCVAAIVYLAVTMVRAIARFQ